MRIRKRWEWGLTHDSGSTASCMCSYRGRLIRVLDGGRETEEDQNQEIYRPSFESKVSALVPRSAQ